MIMSLLTFSPLTEIGCAEVIALVKISIWEESKASCDVVPLFWILVIIWDSLMLLAQAYFCRRLLQVGFVDNGSMSYTALCLSDAKYI